MIEDYYKFLLADKTTNKNILTIKDNDDELTITDIEKILPRYLKYTDEQKNRTDYYGEVFTPIEIIESQTSVFKYDEEWNKRIEKTTLEITCGECPYIATLYNVATGKNIDIKERCGLLDRKLHLINEHSDKKTWLKNTIKAYKSTYAFDLQGDSLFLARRNLLQTFFDYYYNFFDKEPLEKDIMNIIDILCWNVWQMDFNTYRIPSSKNKLTELCKIKDWKENSVIYFKDIVDKYVNNSNNIINDFF